MDSSTVVTTVFDIIFKLLFIVIGYFFYKIICCMAVKKEGRAYSVIVYAACTVTSTIVIYPQDPVNITVALVIFLIVMFFCFYGKWTKKLSITAILFPLVIALNFFASDIMLYIFVISGEQEYMNIVLSLSENIIRIFFWYWIHRTFRQKLSNAGELFDDKTWVLLGIVCFASLASISTCIYFGTDKSYKMWPAALASMATNIGSLYLAGYFVGNIQRDMEQVNLKLRQDYYVELEKNQNEIRRLRHDMNNHLSIVRDLFHEGKREDAEKYLSEIGSQIQSTNRVFCKNSILNAVLNSKYNYALESQIDCFFHIDLDQILGIDAVSLCTIFANTLDNAIEASLKIPEPEKRKISVKARVTDHGYFSYEISNAKANEILQKHGKFVSDKKDRKTHGLGLSNVRGIVERYEGMMDVSYTEDTFTIVILINNAR